MVAPNSCDPCGTCIPANVGNTFFKQATLAALCGNQEVLEAILLALGGTIGVTLKSTEGLASSNGNNTVIAAVPGSKIRVVSYSLQTDSTTLLLARFTDGAGGTGLWRTRFRAPTDVEVGSNLSTTAPNFLFETSAGNALIMNLDSAQDVDYSFTYYEE